MAENPSYDGSSQFRVLRIEGQVLDDGVMFFLGGSFGLWGDQENMWRSRYRARASYVDVGVGVQWLRLGPAFASSAMGASYLASAEIGPYNHGRPIRSHFGPLLVTGICTRLAGRSLARADARVRVIEQTLDNGHLWRSSLGGAELTFGRAH